MNTKRTYRRRKYFVNRSYQGKYVLAIILICAFGLALALTAFNTFSYDKLEKVSWSVHLSAGSVGELIMPYLLYSIAGSVLIVLILLLLFFQYYVHRTIAHLHRLGNYIDMVGGGNLTVDLDWKFQGEFPDTAEGLNQMVRAMREKFAKIKQYSGDISYHTHMIMRHGPSLEHQEAIRKGLVLLRELMER